jgi:hypothetical protein
VTWIVSLRDAEGGAERCDPVLLTAVVTDLTVNTLA